MKEKICFELLETCQLARKIGMSFLGKLFHTEQYFQHILYRAYLDQYRFKEAIVSVTEELAQ